MSKSNQVFRGKASLENQGDRLLETATGVATTPGTEQTLISVTPGAGTTLRLLKVRLSCFFEGEWRLEIDGAQKAGGRVGAGHYNDDFSFSPFEDAEEGETIELFFQGVSGVATDTVDAYLEGRLI